MSYLHISLHFQPIPGMSLLFLLISAAFSSYFQSNQIEVYCNNINRFRQQRGATALLPPHRYINQIEVYCNNINQFRQQRGATAPTANLTNRKKNIIGLLSFTGFATDIQSVATICGLLLSADQAIF